MSLNIVLYVNTFLPKLGGREFVVHYLADALTRLGHRARVVGPSGIWRHRRSRFPYPVHRWPTLRGRFRTPVGVARIFLDTALWGCDVLHAHNTYPTGYFAARLRAIRTFPLVITPHGMDIQSIPEIGHGLRLDPAIAGKIAYALDRADRATAISRNIAGELRAAGADEHKIRLIPNGVDAERFGRPAVSDIRRWLGTEPDARLIVTIGRYNPRKGHEYLIRAMPSVLAAEPKARLVIVGNETQVLRPLIAQQGLVGKVLLTGGISPTEAILMRTRTSEPDYLAELLGGAELYVSAGIERNAEGLSLAVLEAMASGLPVVGTEISGNTDILSNGHNGLLVRPADEAALADAVKRILLAKDVQQGMRLRALETARQYDWLNIARQYVEVYQEAREGYVRPEVARP
jgi:glycosyltransferase involved in cell wall biosynthesis